MPTRLVQSPSHPSGTAALQISGAALAQLPAAELVEIAILQAGSIERFLDPRNPSQPWTTAVYWFRPLFAQMERAGLSLEIDYGVTFHLRANQPYILRLRDQLSSVTVEERFTGPVSMRRPTAPPDGWVPPPDPRGPVEVPYASQRLQAEATPLEPNLPGLPEVEVSLVSTTVDATDNAGAGGTQEPALPGLASGISPKTKITVSVLLCAILLGGGAWWFLGQEKNNQPYAGSSPDADSSLASIRKLIASGPDVAVVRAKADLLAKTGKLLDGQFLLYKYASEKGDATAALAMGEFYDPDLWEKTKSPMPAPNPLEAARWYRQGAEAGDPESAYRYSTLLKKGRTDEVNAEEQAVSWLRKAALKGHAKAKQELGQ